MPIYEYEREDGTRFELIQKMSDEPLASCPDTGQKVKRLISESAFHLKGGGWYKTDYGSSGSAGTEASTSSPKTESSSSAGDSSSSSEAKTSSKSEAKSCGSGCGCH